MPIEHKPFAVFDIETSSTSPTTEVLEVSVCQVPGDLWRLSLADLKAHARAHWMTGRILPEHPERVAPEAAAKNGFDLSVWQRTARPAADVLAQAASLMKGCRLSGHNIVRFDEPRLRRCFKHYGVPWPHVATNRLDTIHLSQAMVAAELMTSASLAHACDHFGVINDRAHSALHDVWATVRCLHEYLSMVRGLATAGRRAIGFSPEARARFEHQREAA